MINKEEYVIQSLEVHLFWARIMKEHLLFLEAGFPKKYTKLIKEAENNRQEEVRAEISKDEARNLIIDRVSILMGEAEERGEEVTLDVVRGLSIDGYEVTSSVTTEEAYIVLNGHQFIINKSFTIIDLN